MFFMISEAVANKVRKKHNIFEHEILECFENRLGPFLEDKREDHKTDPPTKWFISESRSGRVIKVVFIYYPNEREIVIKSAFEPNDIESKIYQKYSNERLK